MKSLSLYIDKWYIVGAVCSDSTIRPIALPNKEDRIWLFFHEDTDNDVISYGKGYKSHFWNRENHYYGDVFSKITDSDATFMRFKHRQPFKDIFKSSKMFDDLHATAEEDGQLKTYLSFSKDISLAARLLFIEQLKSANFIMEESVARIEHLALEYSSKCKELDKEGYYLTLNACNENLYYALYQKSGNLFVRKDDSTMSGMGTDLRGRCLIEYIVDNINRTERFLQDKNEREREYLRCTQYVDDWIVRLNNARPNIPIQITNITLSIDPYKVYSVQVKKSLIDERTSVIVRNVVDDIASFVSVAKVRQEQLCGVLFMGDTLTNQQFTEQLLNHYNIPSDRIIRYMEKDLPSVVSSYSFIDCSQFKDLGAKFTTDAEAELQRIKNLKEEADARQKAEEDAAKAAKQRQERDEEERKYKDAMENGYRFEQERDYDNMADYFKIALDRRSNDAEAKQKYEEALRLKAEMNVRMNNYKDKIREAKTAFDEHDWETAKAKAEEALSAYPESEEAKRIKSESSRALKQSKDFDRYIDRTDLFIAQKLYDAAREELRKARLTDLNDEAVKVREIKIDNEQKKTKSEIERLTDKISKLTEAESFDEAIQCCNDLLSLDLANKTKWTSCIADIRALQEKNKEKAKRLKKLESDIQSAQWEEDWAQLETLCKEYLAICKDENKEKLLRKASEKLSIERELEAIKGKIAEINDHIVHAEYDLANEKLRHLDSKDLTPDIRGQIRELRKNLFEREAEADVKRKVEKNPNFFDNQPAPSTKVEKAHRPVVGFHNNPQKQDNFFDEPSPKHSQSEKVEHKKKDDSDDFFDTHHATPKSAHNPVGTKGHITNDDFNF